jgi:hypothetical protein
VCRELQNQLATMVVTSCAGTISPSSATKKAIACGNYALQIPLRQSKMKKLGTDLKPMMLSVPPSSYAP